MPDEPPINPLVKILDEHLDASLDRLDKGLAPVWESQFQMGRTLVTLASSALVLSISVIQLLPKTIATPRSVWALLAAWVLFGLTVLVGAARQGWAGAAQSLRIRIENQRADLREKVGELSMDDEDLSDKFDAILNQTFEAAQVEPMKAIKIHDALNQVMFWSFTFGLGGLLFFAIRNLPF